MSWNLVLLIFINVCQGAMNRHCIPGLIMSTALTGNFSAECLEIPETMHIGLARRTCRIMPTPLEVDTEETGRYDLAERSLVVFWMSGNSNELSKV